MIDYNDASKTYDHTRKHSTDLIARFAARIILDASTGVLDFGCGTGNYLHAIQTSYGSRCCGVEPSAGMRAIASAKNSKLDIREGDHCDVPFAAETFDFVFMTDVIHHVPELDRMFAELRRVMKQGGFLCIVTESHEQIEGRFYNRYFPSLATNEQQRYPRIQAIVDVAMSQGFNHADNEVRRALPRASITDEFLKNVEEKNFSMFRLLDEEEYAAGFLRLTADRGKDVDRMGAGETLIWLGKPSETAGCADFEERLA